ncbi:MAG: hypothetical protein ACRC1H_18015, partial [Caldilineaceae bacterium]
MANSSGCLHCGTLQLGLLQLIVTEYEVHHPPLQLVGQTVRSSRLTLPHKQLQGAQAESRRVAAL